MAWRPTTRVDPTPSNSHTVDFLDSGLDSIQLAWMVNKIDGYPRRPPYFPRRSHAGHANED